MSVPRTVRVGCAGWNIPREWAAEFPADGSQLCRYSQVFNCVEINSSFYREHKRSTWERWRDAVPADFRFSVKAPRAITHEAKLRCGIEAVSNFLTQVAVLEEKLGPVLFQLPPSLDFDPSTVTDFLAALRQQYAGVVVCEPRHESWFSKDAAETLKAFNVARAAADPACVPVAAHPGGAAAIVYFRLHGSPRRYYSSYNDRFLQALSTTLEERAPLEKCWCVFDNTASGAAVANALDLTRKLQKQGARRTR